MVYIYFRISFLLSSKKPTRTPSQLMLRGIPPSTMDVPSLARARCSSNVSGTGYMGVMTPLFLPRERLSCLSPLSSLRPSECPRFQLEWIATMLSLPLPLMTILCLSPRMEGRNGPAPTRMLKLPQPKGLSTDTLSTP